MATAAVLRAPHDVHTTLNYLKPVSEELYAYVKEPPAGKPRTNIQSEEYEAVVHDVRGKEDTVGLDKTGFQFVNHVSAEKEFLDEERIKTVYYQEVEELLKKYTGGKRVFIFDHTIRRNYSNGNGKEIVDFRGPATRVHVDQTPAASINRVNYHLGDDAERLLKGRVRIINVWRPIGHPVAHHPLAVADYYSVDVENDLVPSKLIYPQREGATFSVKYNPQHRWYYLADQTPEEVTLIKCFDSETDKARLTPHTAFPDKTSPASAPPRQSIEVRALIFDAE
ncbi:hypothetical protein HGRIS_003058 [Hohenbuehelia grisea]|uniref:Methyltransferase n=1 Tax=Hohenbuehelia grisea TaxID=104357 RepID=A0ABR3JNQ1_9AGAR